MRRIYTFYIISALGTAWLIAFNLGFSAGFTNYVPIAALLGCILLLIIAVPLIIYFQKLGLIIGLIACLLMLPYSLMLLSELFGALRGRWKWGILLIVIPSATVLFSTGFTVKALITTKNMSDIAPNSVSKILLVCIPIALFILYLFLYGKYWSWEMFKI